MRILMVNKYLFPGGGAQTYIFKLGEYLASQGHEVQYFGMYHEDNCVGNAVNAYTSTIDFHNATLLEKLMYPFRIIYSTEARRKIRTVLENFNPDVVHLNNFHYQLTPSIIVEIVKWRQEKDRKCRIVFTAHDYNIICPNHMMKNPITHENCEKCLGGRYINCIKGKCIHASRLRSVLGTLEAYYWNARGVYRHIDRIICCSEFMKSKIDSNALLSKKTITIQNFADHVQLKAPQKKDYVLYFGRYSEEKGILTLIEACKKLPEIPFVFAGSGALEDILAGVPNVKNVGFQNGESLAKLIREARFSVYPSEWYENGPFSVIESIMYGTPVLGANIGGIPELVDQGKTGELFMPGNVEDLADKIHKMWDDKEKTVQLSKNCLTARFKTIDQYCSRLMEEY